MAKRKYPNGSFEYTGCKRHKPTVAPNGDILPASAASNNNNLNTINKTAAPKITITTRSRTLTLTRTAVFVTPELLEKALLNLSPADLVTVQHVSKHFHTVITTSPSLQRALFLLPARAKNFWLCRVKHARITNVPLRGSAVLAPLPRPGDLAEKGDITLYPAHLNTLLLQSHNSGISSSGERAMPNSLVRRVVFCDSFTLTVAPTLNINKLPSRTSLSSSSSSKDDAASKMREMYLSQPPATSAILHIVYGLLPHPASPSFPLQPRRRIKYNKALHTPLHNPHGLTWSNVCDAFASAVQNREHGRDWSRVRVKTQSCRVWLRKVVFVSQEERARVEHGEGAAGYVFSEEKGEFQGLMGRVEARV